MGVKLLLFLNKFFKKPEHPFNLRNEGVKSYAMWQYEHGADTLAFFLNRYSLDEMFKNKTVLDIGCGAGGKSVYYASCGAKQVVGLDILPQYKQESEALAAQLGYENIFSFVCADAANTGFEKNSFDTIIMNDAMEHMENPEAVLRECSSLLKPGGRLFVNFPPYSHPYGAHLSDLIGIPWVHVFFSDETLIKAYRQLCSTVPDGDERIKLRITQREDGSEFFSYINKMTIKRFEKIRSNTPIKAGYYNEVPLRNFLKLPARLPFLKKHCVKMIVCIFENHV